MRTFVDTSALYALLDEDDRNHERAAAWFAGPGADASETLVSHAYVAVETAALVHRRLGPQATRVLFDAFIPAFTTMFIDEILHERAVAAFLAAAHGRVSLVDRVSFQLMRDLALDRAFAFDRDFKGQGFDVVP